MNYGLILAGGVVQKMRRTEMPKRFLELFDLNLRMIKAQELIRLFQNILTEDKRVLSLYANYQRSWKDKMTLTSTAFRVII